MEGSTGVVSPAQVRAARAEYAFGRARQAGDMRAAVRGALDAGAERVVICDAHGLMTNLDIAEFGNSVSLASGSPKVLGMVEGAAGCAPRAAAPPLLRKGGARARSGALPHARGD